MALRVVKMLAGLISLIAVTVIIAWLHDARLRARLLADIPPAGEFIETQNANLHFLAHRHADADKPTFVLIHGSSANAHDMMLALGAVLAPHGHVLAFDRPGIGRSRNKISDKAMSDPRKQSREIHQAVKAMGHDNIIVIGQSWGGSVALGYAQEFGMEIQGTVMLAPPIIPWYGPPFWAYRLVTTPIIGPIFAHSILGKYGETQLHAGAEGAAAPEVSPENYVYDAALALILQPRAFITNAVYAIELKHHLADMQKRHLDMPGTQGKLLIMHGNKDRTVNIEYNAESFRLVRDDVELVELNGAGHLLHHTWRHEIADAVLRLVDDGAVRPGRHILEKTVK